MAFAWQGAGDERLLVTVNYAPNQSQCYVRLPFADLGNSQWRLQDSARRCHVSIGMATICKRRGLYLDEPPWQCAGISRLTRG